MHNSTNTANVSFTTVYNAESGFTIFTKFTMVLSTYFTTFTIQLTIPRAALQYFTKFTMFLSTYFTTVYNAESGFTIYCKIYNGALRTLTIFTKFTMVLSMYFQILLNMPMLMLI